MGHHYIRWESFFGTNNHPTQCETLKTSPDAYVHVTKVLTKGLLPVTQPPTGAENAVPVQFAPVYMVTIATISMSHGENEQSFSKACRDSPEQPALALKVE
jgi:hypothetical protein